MKILLRLIIALLVTTITLTICFVVTKHNNKMKLSKPNGDLLQVCIDGCNGDPECLQSCEELKSNQSNDNE